MNQINLFKNLTDKDLRKCYEQRMELQAGGFVSENPLRQIIDEYAKITTNCLIMAEVGLLNEIAERWYKG